MWPAISSPRVAVTRGLGYRGWDHPGSSMSASHTPALRAIAMQLLGALEAYEHAVSRMVSTWPDAQQYIEVNRLMDQIRDLGSTLRGLHSAWAELLIAHAELVQGLLRAGEVVDTDAVAPLRRRHALAAQQLRARVQWLLPYEEGGP